MGTWSTSILGDDFASDVYGEFIEAYNDGKELKTIRHELESKNRSEINDSDDGSIFWLALAKAQWDCGSLDSDVLVKVGAIVNQELGLDRWREGAAPDLEKRKKVLSEFCAKLQTPNPKPKKRKPPKLIPAVFEAGDCLALSLPSGGYGAALVLVVDNSHKIYGQNLVGVLRYRSNEKPPLSVFKSRKWLSVKRQALPKIVKSGGKLSLAMQPGVWENEKIIQWCSGFSFRKSKFPIEKIGSVKIGWFDPQNSKSHCAWDVLALSVAHHVKSESENSH
jgi:hypothetical protein